MPQFLAPIAGAVVGGLMSGDQQASASREPWAPAQPWLKDQIATGQKLQKFYQDNPFSPIQQQAYRNLFAGVDNFNTGVAPGLLSIVNKYMPGAKMSLPQTMNYSGLLDYAFSPQANPFYISPQEKLRLEEEERKRKERESMPTSIPFESTGGDGGY